MARKPNQTRQRLCKVAAGLFAQRGFHGTTMDDVAAGVQLNKGTLYHYFPGKSDILYTICDEIVDDFIRVLDEVPEGTSPVEVIDTLVRRQLQMIAEKPNEVAVFLQEVRWLKEWLSPAQFKEIRAKETAFSQQVIGVIEDGTRSGQFGAVDPVVASHNLMGMVAWASQWFKPKGGASIEHVADETAAMALSGLGAGAGVVR